MSQFEEKIAETARDLIVKELVRDRLGSFGKVFYVTEDAERLGDLYSKLDGVYSTLDNAISAATADRGDVILVDHSYTETVTAAKTISKGGLSIIGLRKGTQRPELTGNGTIDVLSVTGNDVLIQGIAFPAPGTDAQTADINVAGANVTIRDTYHIGSTTDKNKTDIITVASGANDLLVEGVYAYNTVVDCVSFLSLEAAVARAEVKNCVVMGSFSTAVLMDEAAATLAYIHHNLFKNTKAATAVINFTNNSTGVFAHNNCSGRHTTIASNIVTGTGMDFFETYVVEEAALNGLYVPDQDAD